MWHTLLKWFWAESFNLFSPCENAHMCTAELQWSFDCKIFMLKKEYFSNLGLHSWTFNTVKFTCCNCLDLSLMNEYFMYFLEKTFCSQNPLQLLCWCLCVWPVGQINFSFHFQSPLFKEIWQKLLKCEGTASVMCEWSSRAVLLSFARP